MYQRSGVLYRRETALVSIPIISCVGVYITHPVLPLLCADPVPSRDIHKFVLPKMRPSHALIRSQLRVDARLASPPS